MHGHLNVTLKSHILLNAVTATVCTFPTVLNCCLVRIDVFIGKKEETARGNFWKTTNCPAWQMGNWILYLNSSCMTNILNLPLTLIEFKK